MNNNAERAMMMKPLECILDAVVILAGCRRDRGLDQGIVQPPTCSINHISPFPSLLTARYREVRVVEETPPADLVSQVSTTSSLRQIALIKLFRPEDLRRVF